MRKDHEPSEILAGEFFRHIAGVELRRGRLIIEARNRFEEGLAKGEVPREELARLLSDELKRIEAEYRDPEKHVPPPTSER